MGVRATNGGFSVVAHVGDAKTLLAFTFDDPAKAKNLAGFTIGYTIPGSGPVYIWNELQFATPADHAQVAGEPPWSSVNAPLHKFRWVHIPGSAHQGVKPYRGDYAYTVTPRYFDGAGKLLALDPALGVSVTVPVDRFQTKALKVGFTRGFVQSQAFVHHFGLHAQLAPAPQPMQWDTSTVCGTDPTGKTFTYRDAYEWLGFTARELIFEILDEVAKDKTLKLDVCVYDLKEPDVVSALLALAAEGRVRVISDNAALHSNKTRTKLEDRFETQFNTVKTGAAAVLRGDFGRYAHDKIFIVRDAAGPRTVLTGSTNFAVTGIYVNSNHVLVFENRAVATTYAGMFDAAWTGKTDAPTFRASAFAGQAYPFELAEMPPTSVTFSPHDDDDALKLLQAMADRITQEGTAAGGSVMFAVMDMGGGGPVYPALNALHSRQTAFSYGISDNPDAIVLYKPGSKDGVVVTGKPGTTVLPPPFDQVPNIGLGHQVHHKFVVCGFNRPDAVVYCGSSNLALGGEEENGDNLIAVRDSDVATAFAIEALALVDHFNFLDRYTRAAAPPAPADGGAGPPPVISATPRAAAAAAKWFLGTTDAWTRPYFDPNDLHCADRILFAG